MKSKLLLCAVGLFLMATQVNAQHVVRFSPLSLIKGKAKLHYEYGAQKMGFGVIAAAYYGIYPGFRIQPYARYYITDDALTGLYVQPKFHFSQNTFEATVSTNNNGIVTEEKITSDISEFGGAINLGWQFIVGSNENIVIDVFTGYRFSNLHGKDYSDVETEQEGTDAGSEYLYSLLHSNKFDLGLSVGFKF